MTHRWKLLHRPNMNYTYRKCDRCAMLRVSRHESLDGPLHWSEFYDITGARVGQYDTRVPPCKLMPLPAIVWA